MRVSLWLGVLASCFAACSESPGGRGGGDDDCEADADCDEGEVCVDEECTAEPGNPSGSGGAGGSSSASGGTGASTSSAGGAGGATSSASSGAGGNPTCVQAANHECAVCNNPSGCYDNVYSACSATYDVCPDYWACVLGLTSCDDTPCPECS